MSRLWKILTSRTMRYSGGFLVAALGIYGTFFYERKPELSIEVLSSASVLDVREPLTKLAVVFDGTDLRATNQNLYLLVLRVSNSGSADILKSSFDDAAPLGFQLNVGKIVELPSISGDGYLRSNLNLRVTGEREVLFSPVILNASDWFDVRVLLLVPEGQQPSVKPLGKIVGVRKINVTSNVALSPDASYLKRAFSGDWLVQVGRGFGYTFGLFLTLALLAFLIGVPATKISEIVANKKRRKKADDYRRTVNRRLTLKEEYLIGLFQKGSLHYSVFKSVARGEQAENVGLPPELVLTYRESLPKFNAQLESAYGDLEANGLIVRDGPQIQVSEDFIEQSRSFIGFVDQSESIEGAASEPPAK